MSPTFFQTYRPWKNANTTVYRFLIILLFINGLACSQSRMEAKSEKIYTIHLVSVDEWGGTTFTGAFREHKPGILTLHHSGADWEEGRDTREYLRSLQAWSREEKGWIDIPYHYMIDLDGTVYAARDPRYPGDTNTDYNPAGHLLTCLIGNYETRRPTVEQLEALITILAWQCEAFDIDPETLKGHKDYTNQTVCPGQYLYPYISSGFLVRQIARRIGLVVLK